jgi:hypothetical protein
VPIKDRTFILNGKVDYDKTPVEAVNTKPDLRLDTAKKKVFLSSFN